jgi:hypothetical protein
MAWHEYTLSAVSASAPRMLFDSWADTVERETRHVASPFAIATHPAYLNIVNLGKPAIPLILRRMRKSGGHWFWALALITRENPVPEKDRGNMAAMRSAWLKWGTTHGQI